ncbi:MAG: transcriptional regulator [Chloroflexi bacterium]|nr:MAG: transcriptional regulator [Chloroflexota bacterium]
MEEELAIKGQKAELARRIAGEVVLSQDPGKTLRKWRTLLKISQVELANKLGITPSVISDYENNRRRSPGIRMIRKIIESMIEIDASRGCQVLKNFFVGKEKAINAILDIRELAEPISIKKFCKLINARLLTKSGQRKMLYGYTVIDSLVAILYLSPLELVRIYGKTTERALIFTHITGGKSPMVAIKVTNLKPNLVVFHCSGEVSDIAIKIAELEGVPLATLPSTIPIENVIKTLRENLL